MATTIPQLLFTPPSAAEVYELIYYNQQPDSRFIQFLVRNLTHYAPGKRVLDCACGTGEPAIHLAQYFDVVACDADVAMLHLGAKKAKVSGRRLQFCVARWNSLPFRKAKYFDAVTCCGNSIGQLQSIGDLRLSIAGMADSLVSKGVIYIDFRCDYPSGYSDELTLTEVVGPTEYKGKQIVFLVFERHEQGSVERLKVCYFNRGGRLEEFKRIATLYKPFTRTELKHELALAGFTRIRLLQRPGRWPLLAFLAIKA